MQLTITAGNGEKLVLSADQGVNPLEGKGSVTGGFKVKKLKKVDNEKLQKINDVAEKISHKWRLDQMFTEANDLNNGGVPDMKNMGKFFKLVNTDIIKEESDIIVANGLEPKEIFRAVSQINRQFYFDKMDELTFGAT